MFNIFKPKNYVSNQYVGETKKMEIFEDAYTIAERKRKAQENLSKGEAGDDTFIDFAGKKTPIKDLNGQTEQLLSEARSAIRDEIFTNEELKEEGIGDDDVITSEMAKNEIRVKKDKESIAPGAKWDFFSGQYVHGEKKKLGLYRYNSKLNAGAPENIKENRRRTKKAHEEINWKSTADEDSINKMDLISEDKE